jgi:hypothetical protein
MLEQAICDYLQWMKSMEHRHSNTRLRYGLILADFLTFSKQKDIAWKDMFTLDTLKDFRKYTSLSNPSHALIGLSGYLCSNGRIPQPLEIPNYQIDLPDIYEQYLLYHEQIRQDPHIGNVECSIKSHWKVLKRLNQ